MLGVAPAAATDVVVTSAALDIDASSSIVSADVADTSPSVTAVVSNKRREHD
jgi:hypothetical protein